MNPNEGFELFSFIASDSLPRKSTHSRRSVGLLRPSSTSLLTYPAGHLETPIPSSAMGGSTCHKYRAGLWDDTPSTASPDPHTSAAIHHRLAQGRPEKHATAALPLRRDFDSAAWPNDVAAKCRMRKEWLRSACCTAVSPRPVGEFKPDDSKLLDQSTAKNVEFVKSS